METSGTTEEADMSRIEALAAAFLVAAAVFIQPGIAAAQKTVYQVTSVSVEIQKKKPPNHVVSAKGQVRTQGWSNPALVLAQDKPVDRVYIFDFIAQPPAGQVPQVVTPIEASGLSIETEGEGLYKGVQVRAETNCILYLSRDEK